MFPLTLILFVGLFPFDATVIRYAFPLSLTGAGVALYHALLQAGIIPDTAAPCQAGVSCTEISFALFGVLSIPVLSLFVFVSVTTLLLVLKRSSSL